MTLGREKSRHCNNLIVSLSIMRAHQQAVESYRERKQVSLNARNKPLTHILLAEFDLLRVGHISNKHPTLLETAPESHCLLGAWGKE